MPCIFCSSHLDGFLRWEVSDRTAVSWNIASRICSKYLVAFLCSSHQAFSQCVLFVPKWCIHTIVLTQPQFVRNPVSILSDRSDFHMIDNQSIIVLRFTRHILKSLSVNEILLPSYVNLSTNSRSLTLQSEMAPSRVKHMYSFIYVGVKANASCCLL